MKCIFWGNIFHIKKITFLDRSSGTGRELAISLVQNTCNYIGMILNEQFDN